MALAVKDGAGSDQTLKTTTDGSDLIPHHLIGSDSLSSFRNLATNSTAVAVKANAGSLYGFNIINLDVTDNYVKFYNVAAASVNPASDVPVLTLFLPAGATIFQEPSTILHRFGTAIAVRTVTGSGDTNTTAPGTSPIIELKYA